MALTSVVFIVLLILKLTGLITVSWFWVFFPLWVVPAILFTLIVFGSFVGSIGK